MTDLFTVHRILLVTKLEGPAGDVIHIGKFIQRYGGRAVDGVVDGEVEVPELERLGAGLGCGGVGVFGRAEEPEEADDDKVVSDCVEDAPFGVVTAEVRRFENN